MPNKALTKVSYSWDCCKLKQDFFRSRPPAAGRSETHEVLRPCWQWQSGARVCFWVVAGGKSTFSCQSPLLPFLVCKICSVALLDNILQKRKQRKYVCISLADVSYIYISSDICVCGKDNAPLLPFLGQLTCVWGAARKGISHYSVHGALVKVWWRCQRGRTSGYKRSVRRCNNA